MPDDYGLASAQHQRDRQEPPDRDDSKLHCSRCGGPIYEGEEVFEIRGEDLCGACAFDVYGRYA